MSEYVGVGDMRVTPDQVTQELLCRACEWLSGHGRVSMSDGYRPSVERFRHPDAYTDTPEEYAYLLFDNPEIAPKGFRAAFIDPPKATEPTPPEETLRDAGFPKIVCRRQATERRSPKLEAWASAQGGDMAPWLWVRGGRGIDRTTTLAQAAVLASGIQAVYKSARDLCEEVNSADMYGKNSGHNRLEPYRTCGLLMLDGMGEEHAGARELDTILQVVAARWQNLLPTAFASRMGLKEWIRPYTGMDEERARDLAGKVVEGLSGYAMGGRDEVSRAAGAHIIVIGGETGGA